MSPKTKDAAPLFGTWRLSSAARETEHFFLRFWRSPEASLMPVVGAQTGAVSCAPLLGLPCNRPIPSFLGRLCSFGSFESGIPAGPFSRALQPAASASARGPLYEFWFLAKKAAAVLGSSWPDRKSGVPGTIRAY